MNTRLKFWISGTAALAGMGVLIAGAQAGTAPDQTGFAAPSYNLAARYDANNDNQVSQAEIDANRKAWHAQYDADKNGALSEPEFAKLWETTGEPWSPDIFKSFDKTADGGITLDEYLKPMADAVALNDKNGDGLLSRADHRKRAGAMPDALTQ